ncbi:hypothetical protein DV740_06115 [Roseburia sp. AF02-12]|uniref:hypothetical protein n=1 Tax=unclassified Roseburia TaxID=2637578 RepID=UPI000E4ED34A|nr:MULTISPECIES: hypothetical protein [unclassified Roseburia]RGF54730.1 hypothetical protein DWZ65_14160 [Roseburia sp. AF34-16]RGH30974.1 hypothetical protein DV740_06115 [Roseburia sp. AF02-12]
MSTIDELLKYMKKRDKSILITNNQLSDYELNVVVVKILSWLKLEHKRSIWIAQGKKTRFKSLEVDIRYPWCANLYQLVENEKLFHDYFSIKEGEFDFSDEVSEEEKVMAREKAYQNYNPQKHI